MARWLFLFLAAATTLCGQVYQGKTLVTPKLVADTSAIVPGQPFRVGVLLETVPDWHTYWEYSGDAGIPTQLKWALPAGFQAGPIQWPLPERLFLKGDIEDYGYGTKVLLITQIMPPATLAEKEVTLPLTVNWLVCADTCIPGTAKLSLTLPVAAQAQPANAGLFREFTNQLPSNEKPPYTLKWEQTDQAWTLSVTGLGNAKAADLYPLPADKQLVGHPKNSPVKDGAATITIETKGDLRGVLVVDGPAGRKGWYVSSAAKAESLMPPAASSKTSALNLWTALFYGFLGGLILNLMPCVLPVISLKIFGFVKQAGDHPERILRHGLAFVAGIFVWFLGLAGLIIALKSAGHQVTWAFQFQNPWFNFLIGCVVFVFALNLFGVFEIILPGRANNALAEASERGGYAGSFFQGVFATLLATPCTAPFLGASLGFAFAQSSLVIVAIFGAIAFGMAAPYFLLSAQPGWMKVLPKPGAWMERLKQFMGFPLLATLVWLWSVLGAQKGVDGVTWASAYLLCLAVACWLLGAFAGPLAKPGPRVAAFVLSVVILVGGGWLFLPKFVAAHPRATAAVSFQKTLDELLAEKKAVFVDFTAEWCVSCKYNEKFILGAPAVREAFRKNDVVLLKADWTNSDPEITAALEKFGRVGVPFYVLYPAGRADQPIVLPELLTQQIVLDALARAR